MKQVLICVPRNDHSGVCISMVNLKKIFEKNKIDVILGAPIGCVLDADIILESNKFNPLSMLINLFRILKNDYDLIIFNSIWMFIYPVFFRKSLLYLHESQLGPKWFFDFVVKIINLLNIKVAVVNPKMREIFKESIFIPNCTSINCHDTEIKSGVLMISNLYKHKGFYEFIELVKKFEYVNFTLLYNNKGDKECFDFLRENNFKNLTLVKNQDEKEKLLIEAKILIALSKLRETFGLVLSEAISRCTLPIGFSNDGYDFCLNYDKELLLNEDNYIESFEKLLKKVEDKVWYENKINSLVEYHKNNFSESAIIEKFRRLL